MGYKDSQLTPIRSIYVKNNESHYLYSSILQLAGNWRIETTLCHRRKV
jgi:hypothetical protein